MECSQHIQRDLFLQVGNARKTDNEKAGGAEVKLSRTVVLILLTAVYAFLPEGHQSPSVSRSVNHENWDGNNISSNVGNHGDVASYHTYGVSGLEWPIGSGNYAIFQDGFWLASGIADGNYEIRTAATKYDTEYIPGVTGSDPDSSVYRIYMLSADDGPSSQDWIDWPVDQGAPWIDNDSDGNYDPNVDQPEIMGDLFYWYVMNDTSQEMHNSLYGTNPLGVEVRTSVFGFDNIYPLENTLFMKWNFTNVGSTHLDSVFFGRWSDIDIGEPFNDLAGVDTTLGLAYCYNDSVDYSYGIKPPAVGYVILQTPIVPSPGDTAWVSGNEVNDFRNSSINAFINFQYNYYNPPFYAREVYRYLNGRNRYGDAIIDPTTNAETKFMYNGDPVNDTGWVQTSWGDRRFLFSAGPFTLAPGDTQEVVEAIIISQGASDVLSVASLREDTKWVRNTWESNFTQMGAPATVRETNIPHNTESNGPFDLHFSIKSNPGWVSAPLWFVYDVNGVLDSTVLQAVNDTLFQASIPGLSNITGTTEFKYWIKILTNTNTTMTWPSAAPPNYNSFIFGPDTTAPFIGGLTKTNAVHIQLPVQKKIHVTAIEDDRFGTYLPLLHWQVNDGNISSVEMVDDSMQVSWNMWAETWSGVISTSVSDLSDSLFYWASVRDSSTAQNEGTSEKGQIQLSIRDTVGFWYDAQYDDMADWDMFTYGEFQNGFVYDDLDWGQVLISHLNANDDTEDTLTYSRILDLSGFDDVWLTIPMAANFRDNPNFGVLEFSDDGEFWTPRQTFTGNISPRWLHYDLSAYTNQDHFQFRFRVHCESQFTEWVIDDIVLHSDSTVLGIENNPLLPIKFSLHQNYPNPFNPVTTLRYDLPENSYVNVTVYDILGRQVRTLVNTTQNAGFKSVIWNATNDYGKPVSAGVYLYQIQAGEFVKTKKMVLLK